MQNPRAPLSFVALLLAFALPVTLGAIAAAASPVLQSAFKSYAFDPQAVAPIRIADLDHSGSAEIVSGAQDPQHNYYIIVSRWISNQWQRVQTFPVGSLSPAFVISDVNHDGFSDLVYTMSGLPYARVNDGTGMLGAATPIAGATNPDGNFLATLISFKRAVSGDVFFALEAGGGFVIFRDSVGTGGIHNYLELGRENNAGLLQKIINNGYPDGLPPVAAEADLNGDGIPDIAAFTEPDLPNSSRPAVRVFMNAGGGTYAPSVDTYLGPDANGQYTRPEFIFAADVDGDGDTDLLVGRDDTEIAVLINDGAGHFTQSTTPQTDLGVTNDPTVHAAMADVNGDGRSDYLIEIIDHLDLSLVLDLHGSILYQIPTGNSPYGIAVGDLDRDGAPDLIILNQSTPHTLGVYLGRGGDQFGDVVATVVLPEKPLAVAVGNLDSDSTPDLAIVGYNDITTLLSTNPTTPTPYALPATGTNVAVGVGVGSLPLAAQVVTTFDSRQPGQFPSSSAGVLGAPTLFGGLTGEEVSVATGDLNGDHRYDIAASILVGGRDSVIVWLSTASGFLPPVEYAVGAYVRELAIADLNGDGAPDIVTVNDQDASISVLLNTGTGTMGPATDYFVPGGLTPYSLAIGSLVGPDNYPDVAVALQDANQVFVFKGNGLGGFTPQAAYPVGAGPASVRAGDIDADGNLDLVTADLAGNTVSVLAGAFSGGVHSLSDAVSFGSCHAPQMIALGNFTHHADGSLDVIAIGSRTIPAFVASAPGARPAGVNATTETALFYLPSVPRSTTAVPASPTQLSLDFSNAPNPFRGATELSFGMPREGHATLDVFDVAGRRVARLADRPFGAGLHHVRWEGRDDSGGRIAPGVYLARVTTPSGSATRRLVWLP